MNKPLLSIGIIFKNDIRCIERCLKSLDPLRKAIPCELVMADTGSTDGSRAVAEQYADILFDFAWVNDFSAARNAVMDRCCGKWYFTVDTDEYLDKDVSELVHFLTSSHKMSERRASVVQRNYRTRDMRSGDYSDFLALRMIRMDTGLRYQGTIHEAWGGDNRKLTACALWHTILHHDGYAKDAKQDLQAKMDRDLVLLREELAREPNSMRRLIQCQDASLYYPEERWEYLVRGMKLVEQLGKKAVENHMAAVLYRNAVCAALYQKMPQADQWLAWGESHMAQSIFFRVDVMAAASSRSYLAKDYEATLTWTRRYLKGMNDYKSGRYDVQELTVTSLLSGMESTLLSVTMVQCDALAHLEQKEEAIKLLETVDLSLMEGRSDLCTRMLNLLITLAAQGDAAQQLCAQLLAMVWEKEEAWAKDVLQHTMMLINQLLQERHSIDTWKLFTQAPGDLGRSVSVVELEQPQEITASLAAIERWDQVPVQVLAYAVEQCAPLPQAFFRRGEEALREMAVSLGADPVVREQLPYWVECDDFCASMTRYQFLFQLTAASLRNAQWDGEGQQLLGLFIQLASGYLPALYNAQLLADEEEWMALPGLHRCALYLLQAQQAGDNGNELGYVRALRAALSAAPAMKGAVDELLAHPPVSEAQRQLEQLAQQVRTVLAQYAPDDPAVEALKASPAYQKVAHLLEPMASPAKPQEPPVSPVPLEEALAGSREEIAASIRENLGRWGQKPAQRRMDYWEKYPLWGKNADEVVDNLSAALSAHAADFRWLFDRLEDEKSRRILTAVVRGWRFYEFEPLGEVVDQENDESVNLDLSHIHSNEMELILQDNANHIREDRPKLALSVYHNFEALWKLPRIIDGLAPGYHFYLRYYGGVLWPSETILLGIPDEER